MNDTENSDRSHRHYDSHDAGPEWGTPPWIWEPLADALGGFDLDPASGAERKPIADTRWTVEQDGLSRPWFGDVWLNPPYGRSHNPEWAEKAAEEAESPVVDTLTALVPASTDTRYFQGHYSEAKYLTYIKGRVSFDGAGDSKASFPSVIASWGEFPDGYVARLDEIGFVTRPIDRKRRALHTDR